MYCRKCGSQIDDNAVFCAHCRTATGRRAMPPPFAFFDKSAMCKDERSFPCTLSPDEVDARMCNLSAYGVDFTLTGRNERPDGFEYTLSVGANFWSWGERMYVQCVKQSTGSQISVFSGCIWPLQWVAFGKNGRNIEKIRLALTAR